MSHLAHLVILWWPHTPRGFNIHQWIAAHAGNGCGAIHSGTWSC